MTRFPRGLAEVVMCGTLDSSVSKPGTNTTLHTMLHFRTLQEKSVVGFFDPFVDDLFGTGGTEMEKRVPARPTKDFQVGSEDWNDVTFTKQRIRWTKDPQSGPCIEVSQEKAIEKLEEISVDRNTKENLCALLQRIQGTEVFWDRKFGCRVGHCFSVATSSPDVV